MPTFKIDVKAFLSVTVEADTLEGAIEEAKALTEGLSPSEHYVAGWNSGRAEREEFAGRSIIETGGFDCEDAPYCEDENGDEIEPGDA